MAFSRHFKHIGTETLWKEVWYWNMNNQKNKDQMIKKMKF